MNTNVAMQETIKRVADELKRLQEELDNIRCETNQFERIDTDVFLTEVYNG